MPDTATLPVPPAAAVLHRFTLEEFHEVWRASLHRTGLSYELLDGGIYEMPADGPRTIEWNAAINRWLVRTLPDAYVVIPDKTLRAGEFWGPKPDFYVFDARLHASEVTGADVLLAIEVSEATLADDLRLKRPRYEQSGVRELWIIDVDGRRILVHRLGPDSAYGEPLQVAFDEAVSAVLVPGLSLRLSDLPCLS